MKPSPFTYHRPTTVDDALLTLAQVGAHGKVLAGGQSLLPILSMRLAAPEHLVDVNRLAELDYVRAEPDGVRVGALARHATVERDGPAAAVQPLLRQGLALVAHPTIRNRGTTVGSLAHADPSGELTAVLALTGGRVTVASSTRRRDVPASEFFLGPLESAVRPGELALEAYFPAPPPRSGTAFVEVARRHGDYAVAGLAAAAKVQGTTLSDLRLAFLSLGDRPLRARAAEAVLQAGPLSEARIAEADAALRAELDPFADLTHSAAAKKQLAATLLRRAIAVMTKDAA